jgi:hypothetical protein
MSENKHKNYVVLNLIGYGLAKFNNDFTREFGVETKTALYEYFVQAGVAETIGTVKNRQDLFDPFFENGRKGWWQKGDTYIHRKIFIDHIFGNLGAADFAAIVKLYLLGEAPHSNPNSKIISPITKSKFKQLQETGEEAEIFFMENFRAIPQFKDAAIEDARKFGDGYDFQIQIENEYVLAEVKGVRSKKGAFRLTENEHSKAREYKQAYGVFVVSNLEDMPKMTAIFDPISKLIFAETVVHTKQLSFHSQALEW